MSHSAEMVQASPEQVRSPEGRESVSRYTAKSKELALRPACGSRRRGTVRRTIGRIAILGDKKKGTSLVVQWSKLCPSSAGGPSAIPVQETRSFMLQLRAGTAK